MGTHLVGVLLAAAFLLGCTSSQEYLEQANGQIKMADVALTEGRIEDAKKLNSQARANLNNVKIDPKSTLCDQLGWDNRNSIAMLDILDFQLMLKKGNPDQINGYPEQILGNYNSIGSSVLVLKDFEFVKEKGCPNIVNGPVYAATIKKLADVRKYAEVEFDKLGVGLSLAKIVERDTRISMNNKRINTWDQLSNEEKLQAAGNNPRVQACIDAALAKNNGMNGVSNIVSDVATLCRNGLR